jgi:hypothetical protein
MLNSEKRILEDELYELEYELEDALSEVDQLRDENERLNRSLGVLPSDPSSLKGRRPASTRKSKSSDLNLSPPVVDENSLTEPKIEIPDQKPSQPNRPSTRPAPMAPAVPMTFISPVQEPPNEPQLLSLLAPEINQSIPSSVSSGPERLALEPTDPRITQVYLDPLLTGGSDFDRQPGDDGLAIVLQPRNQENQFVPLAGPISVVLIDPTQDQASARVARWDLEARDIEQAIQASNTDPGIRLRLPWPNEAPPTNRLQLFVRYETVDGRKLEASREIFITLPGQFSQRWTPRSTGRPRVLVANQSVTHRTANAALAVETKSSSPDTPADVQTATHSEDVDAANDRSSPSATPPGKSTPSWQPQR